MDKKKISREAFEHHFKQVNASWSYENAEVNEEEKELIYKRLIGEISEEDFKKAIAKLK